MTGAAGSGEGSEFRYQLGALLRARRAVSRQQRRDGKVSWWAGRLALGAAAVFIVLGLVGLGAASAESDRDPARSAVIFLLAPCAAAGYLVFGQLQAANTGHPLGTTRNVLPLSRRRSATLALLERVLSPSALFVAMVGIAPWLGLWSNGGGWLSAAGWVSILLFPLVPLVAREVLLGIQQYITEALKGLFPAGGGLVMTVFFVTLPFWATNLAGVVDIPRVDVFALPALEVLNAPHGPVLALAGIVAFGCLGVLMQAVPPPRRGRVGRSWRPIRLTMPSVSFDQARPEVLMARMMLVQASRQPVYIYTAALVVVIGAIAIVFPSAPGAGLLFITGYLGPASSLFNLYGGDAKHYQLWLATGRRLEEWTRARQLFGLAYVGLFGAASTVVMFVSGFLSGTATFVCVVALVDTAIIGLIAGPAVSRVVLTPAIAEAGTYSSSLRTARSYLAWVCAFAAGATAVAVSLALVEAGVWWLAFGVPAGLLGLAAVVRSDRREWTADLRLRMAKSLR